MSAAGAQTIGKAALASVLGWTRPKLDRRLNTDPAFPVVKRGSQQGGWEFDQSQVETYLSGAPVTAQPTAPEPSKRAKRKGAIDKAQLAAAVKPPQLPQLGAKTVSVPRKEPAQHSGEANARQRKDAADAGLKEDKLRQSRKELIARSVMRQLLSDVFATLGNELDGLPEKIAKRLDLPDAAPDIRELIDKARTEMVDRVRPLLDE